MTIEIQPVAYVTNNRETPEDDDWGAVTSVIELADHIATEALDRITDFSHLEIIYHFHLVPESKAIARSRHPRNNKDWPVVGTFGQRNKSRPNRIGITTVKLVQHNDRKITVLGLDAIHGTPVIDIKPVMQEFLPSSTIKQPQWSKELMANYWNKE